MASFVDRYVREYAAAHKKTSTRIQDERRLTLNILPALGSTKLRDIDRAHVARLHASLIETPVTANRVVDLLSAILGWAERVGERPQHSNPCRHIDRYPEKARERFLTAPELARLGDALDRCAEAWTPDSKAEWHDLCLRQAEEAGESNAGTHAAGRTPTRDSAEDWRAIAAVRLLITTGGRVSEILMLRWEWIDAARGTARLPDSKTGARICICLPPRSLYWTRCRAWRAIRMCCPAIGQDHIFVGSRSPGSASASSLPCLIYGCTICGMRSQALPWPAVTACSSSERSSATDRPARPNAIAISLQILR